jgi:hypothetical protein
MDGHPWPLYDLRIRTERLELRFPTEDELVELLGLALSGIHDPAEMPFGFAWTDQESPQLERSFMQYHWSRRATFGPEDWTLDLGVWLEGRQLVGTQGIGARQFAQLKSVAPRGEVRELVRYRITADNRITADKWHARERPHVEVEGMERCWDLFGVA